MTHMKTILILDRLMLAIAGWSQSADPALKAPLLLGSRGCAQYESPGGDVQAAGPAQ